MNGAGRSDMVQADGAGGRLRLAAFAALAVPIAAAQMPMTVYLPAIYAQHYGLSLGMIGAIFLVERLWGAVADPLVGSLSDHMRSPLGRRRPWIMAGALLYAVSTVALFFPPDRISPLYLAGALFAFYFGASMVQIPYLAWSGELSRDYHQRTRIATYQAVTTSVALLLVLVLPTVVDQFRPQDGPLKLAIMGVVILSSLAVSLALTLSAFPEPPIPPVMRRASILSAFRTILGETLLMRVLFSDFAVRGAQSIRGGLFVFFVAVYMGEPQWASALFLLQFTFGIAAGPIWARVGYHLGKHRAAIAGEVVQIAINLCLLLVRPGDLALLIALTIAQGLAQNSANLMLRSMVADVADQHRLRTGLDRTGIFFSAFSLSEKAGTAVAVGVALPLVAWLGFDPKGQSGSVGMQGFLYVFALGPALAHLVSALLIRGFPLDEVAHGRIQRALEERDRAQTR